MDTFFLKLYNDMLLAIKRGNGVSGKSNAKPILLLSIMECISLNKLRENRIMWDDVALLECYSSFNRYFLEDNKSPMSVPYYHLGSSPFYHLIWKDQKNRPPIKGKTPSEKYLRENLLYACLDEELWSLLNSAESREYLRRNIILRYFTNIQQ